MSDVAGVKINFRSINPVRFYFKKRNEGMKNGFGVVITILHFLPRFQREPEISENFRKLTGRKPTTLREFLKREVGKITRLDRSF